jgi:hypothetical protein
MPQKRSVPSNNAGHVSVCAPETGIGLIVYVRPTSDSEAEEAKGDGSGAMAPPPVPPAKKVRV